MEQSFKVSAADIAFGITSRFSTSDSATRATGRFTGARARSGRA
jgi:hypothetical protein